jgi:hypothetical protein
MARQVHDLRRVQQRLRRHTAAQNTQAPHLLAAFNNRRLQPFARCPRRR